MIIDKINTHKSNSYNTLCNCKACSALKKLTIIGGLDLQCTCREK